MMATDASAPVTAHARISGHAASFGVELPPEEIAGLAVRNDPGQDEPAAPERALPYLAEKHHDQVIETMPGLSRPPQKAPKALGGFDSGRIRGRDAAALRRLPSLSNLHARKNLAFIGPCGIGETHLARAYGRECRPNGHKTYYLKATELRGGPKRAVGPGHTPRLTGTLVRPSRPIVDEAGRRTLDHARANPSLGATARRHGEDGPNTMILTSSVPASNRDGLPTGGDTLPCAPGRPFDRAVAPMMKGAGSRGPSRRPSRWRRLRSRPG